MIRSLTTIAGIRLTVEFTPDAYSTWAACQSQRDNCLAQMLALLERLANIGRLHSPEQFRAEGEAIFAIKARCGLRAYGWFHRTRRAIFVVSHFMVKKTARLDSRDLRQAGQNRELYESGVGGRQS
jgi:hypothetical protein